MTLSHSISGSVVVDSKCDCIFYSSPRMKSKHGQKDLTKAEVIFKTAKLFKTSLLLVCFYALCPSQSKKKSDMLEQINLKIAFIKIWSNKICINN